jgi:hypothetical protein
MSYFALWISALSVIWFFCFVLTNHTILLIAQSEQLSKICYDCILRNTLFKMVWKKKFWLIYLMGWPWSPIFFGSPL